MVCCETFGEGVGRRRQETGKILDSFGIFLKKNGGRKVKFTLKYTVYLPLVKKLRASVYFNAAPGSRVHRHATPLKFLAPMAKTPPPCPLRRGLGSSPNRLYVQAWVDSLRVDSHSSSPGLGVHLPKAQNDLNMCTLLSKPVLIVQATENGHIDGEGEGGEEGGGQRSDESFQGRESPAPNIAFPTPLYLFFEPNVGLLHVEPHTTP